MIIKDDDIIAGIRHLARLPISGELLTAHFSGKNWAFCLVNNALPGGTKFVGFIVNETMGIVELVLEHKSFPIVSPGAEIPRFEPEPLFRSVRITALNKWLFR